MKEDNTLWWRVIEAKFGAVDRGWFFRILARQHEKGMWKKIFMDKNKFHTCIRWRVGRGDKNRFWQDLWLKRRALRDQFPQAFAIARHKYITIYGSFRDIGGKE